MADTMKRYWLNIGEAGSASLHATGCSNCIEDVSGGFHSWAALKNWRGHYASRGAAIDAALSIGRRVEEKGCCISDRVNENQ